METVVDMRGLVKRFGNQVAVSDLSLRLDAGDVFGFIGPNGAGKTTTLRILATLAQPDSGTVEICGIPLVQAERIRPLIGYMPDFFGVYEDITVTDYLQFYARIYNIEPQQRPHAIRETVALTGLEPIVDRVVDKLSRGQKQRLGLARAMLHKPRLMLLDEPASGLDPEARIEFREIIHELGRQGTCIIVSSHVLSDLSDMCNQVGILQKGILCWNGRMEKLMAEQTHGRRMRLKVLGDGEVARQVLLKHSEVTDVVWERQDLVFKVAGEDKALAILLRALMDEDVTVVSFAIEDPSLEQVYLDIVHLERERMGSK
jgi:ABC-2 type transport system ATP-binding protein